MIFDDFYSCQISEEYNDMGELTFIAEWEQIESQSQKGSV